MIFYNLELYMKALVAASLMSSILLAACVSGGKDASYDEMYSRGKSLVSKFESEDPTPVGAMPTTGTATYSGVAGFGAETSEQVEVMSQASLAANFATSSISGNLTNFRDYENNSIPGSVAIQNTSINGNQFTAPMNGSLTVNGAPSAVNGTMVGAFGGANANSIAGIIEGTVGSQQMYGLLGAEKQ
jgi:hypothetical protein